MVKIKFLESYLTSKNLKNVNIIMSGIININVNIKKFKFEIIGNKLKIKDDKFEILEIVFDEVRDVINDGNIVIKFNMNEQIIIK